MNAKNRALIAASLVGFLMLGGCSAAKTPTASASANSSPAAGQQASSNFQPVVHVIGATRRLVKAGDFATAKTEFAKFPTRWSKVQAGVKTKSPDAYSEVESAQQQVAAALQSGDQAKAMMSLRALKAAVVKASK
jgi:hypothetical protein